MTLTQHLGALATAIVLTVGATLSADATTDPLLSIARATTYLLTAPLTPVQVQTLHAQNFQQLPPSLRPLYLHAVAFKIGAISGGGEELPVSALAEYLQTANPDAFIGIDSLLSEEDAALITGADREVNVLLADQIAANVGFQRAIQSGAVNGFTLPIGGGGSL